MVTLKLINNLKQMVQNLTLIESSNRSHLNLDRWSKIGLQFHI